MSIPISIIVPVYNMEKLMRKCLDSILAQTFQDYECLLIDDGSKDGSPAICDEYAQKDERVKVFHKPNGGLSDARNYGLEQAQGKYTIFADPDDWVDAEGLNKLFETAEQENADMTICDFYREDEHARHYEKQEPSSLDHVTILKELFSKIHGSTCNKLIKRELYEKYNIQNPVGIYGCEDQYVMASFLKHDIKIAYCPVAFYHYMYNPNSLIRHYDEKTYQMDKNIILMFSNLLEGTTAQKVAVNNKQEAMVFRAFLYGNSVFRSKDFKKEFGNFKKLIHKSSAPIIQKQLTYLSCLGGYQLWNRTYWKLFSFKQILKKIKS